MNKLIYKIKTHNLYVDISRDSTKLRDRNNKYGWLATQTNNNSAIENLKDILNKNETKVNDIILDEQISQYSYSDIVNKNKRTGMNHHFDDLKALIIVNDISDKPTPIKYFISY